MRWRGVSSLPSSNSPSPSLQPSARPGRPRQAGRRPQAHSSPHCHTAEIKDTSLSWVPANRFKSESGGGGSEPQLHATCKGGLEPICPQPPGQRPGVRHWGGGCHITHTHQAPSHPPGVSKSPSEPQTLDCSNHQSTPVTLFFQVSLGEARSGAGEGSFRSGHFS